MGEALVNGERNHEHESNQMTDLRDGHFFSYCGQFNVAAFHLDALVKELEKGVFHDPFKVIHPNTFIEGLALDKIQVGQFFIVLGFRQHAVEDHPDHPRDEGYGYSEGEGFEEHGIGLGVLGLNDNNKMVINY